MDNVLISSNPNDKVQCIGYDDKGRKQYKYNTEFIQEQSDIKYYDTLIKFGKKINTIRTDIESLLRKNVFGTLKKLPHFLLFMLLINVISELVMKNINKIILVMVFLL